MQDRAIRAWQAFGGLLGSPSTQMKAGDLDDVGARGYGKPATLPGQSVFNLQCVLDCVVPDDSLGPPDGAFGSNTERALFQAIESRVFVYGHAMPIFAALLGKHVADELVQDQTTEQAMREGTEEVETALSEGNGVIKPMLIAPVPEHFNQADPRWAERKMGVELKMQRGGCGICAIAMLFNWVSMKFHQGSLAIGPDVLDHWMDENGGYLAGTNQLIWETMPIYMKSALAEELFHQAIGDRDHPLTQEIGLEKARELLSQPDPWPIILRVQNKANSYGQWFNHFVLGVGIDEYGEIRFLDPRNSVGGDLTHPQNNTSQTINKGGYNVVALQQFGRTPIA